MHQYANGDLSRHVSAPNLLWDMDKQINRDSKSKGILYEIS
nr:MAG TPA: hypothetical protein [Caudoviricetes sp.]